MWRRAASRALAMQGRGHSAKQTSCTTSDDLDVAVCDWLALAQQVWVLCDCICLAGPAFASDAFVG